jgi:hypothetical protein
MAFKDEAFELIKHFIIIKEGDEHINDFLNIANKSELEWEDYYAISKRYSDELLGFVHKKIIALTTNAYENTHNRKPTHLKRLKDLIYNIGQDELYDFELKALLIDRAFEYIDHVEFGFNDWMEEGYNEI